MNDRLRPYHSNYQNEELKCITFIDDNSMNADEVISFKQALKQGIQSIPQTRRAYRVAELEEHKYRSNQQLNNDDDLIKERDKWYKYFPKIGNELPAVERFYSLVGSKEELKDEIKAALLEAQRPSKVNIQLHFILRSENRDGTITFRPESLGMKTVLSSTTDMLYNDENKIEQFCKKELSNLEYFANGFEYLDSREKYCACFAISLAFYKLPSMERAGAGGYEELNQYTKWNQWIKIDNFDDNLCLFRALFHFQCRDETKRLYPHTVSAGAKVLYQQFYNKKI